MILVPFPAREAAREIAPPAPAPVKTIASLRFIAEEAARLRQVLDRADGVSGAVLSSSVDAALTMFELAAKTALPELRGIGS